MIDLRRIRVGIEFKGRIQWYDGLRVRATGTKFANPTQNDCTVTISGLSTQVRDSLISTTETDTRKLIVEAGRISTGLHRIFTGDITAGEPSSPPDVDVVLKSKTGNAWNDKVTVVNGTPMQKLSTIARRISDDLKISLDFQATDKNIANYSFSGASNKQINRLQDAGQVQAYVDDDRLIVKDLRTAIKGRVRLLSLDTGMVGIPKRTEQGVEVTYLIDGPSDLGGVLELNSLFNKPLNGKYTINQLKFDITSHEDAFYYQALCSKLKT